MTDILVVDDDEHIRESLVDLLEGEGYSVRTAADGLAALAAWSEKRPDLMLLDVMMPKKSGYDVCREIRKEDGETAILMLSAKSDEAAKVLGLGLGAGGWGWRWGWGLGIGMGENNGIRTLYRYASVRPYFS